MSAPITNHPKPLSLDQVLTAVAALPDCARLAISHGFERRGVACDQAGKGAPLDQAARIVDALARAGRLTELAAAVAGLDDTQLGETRAPVLATDVFDALARYGKVGVLVDDAESAATALAETLYGTTGLPGWWLVIPSMDEACGPIACLGWIDELYGDELAGRMAIVVDRYLPAVEADIKASRVIAWDGPSDNWDPAQRRFAGQMGRAVRRLIRSPHQGSHVVLVTSRAEAVFSTVEDLPAWRVRGLETMQAVRRSWCRKDGWPPVLRFTGEPQVWDTFGSEKSTASAHPGNTRVRAHIDRVVAALGGEQDVVLWTGPGVLSQRCLGRTNGLDDEQHLTASSVQAASGPEGRQQGPALRKLVRDRTARWTSPDPRRGRIHNLLSELPFSSLVCTTTDPYHERARTDRRGLDPTADVLPLTRSSAEGDLPDLSKHCPALRPVDDALDAVDAMVSPTSEEVLGIGRQRLDQWWQRYGSSDDKTALVLVLGEPEDSTFLDDLFAHLAPGGTAIEVIEVTDQARTLHNGTGPLQVDVLGFAFDLCVAWRRRGTGS